MAQLTKRKQELDVRRAANGDKPVPPVLERELANIDEELAKQSELLAGKRRDADAVNARYDADKQRWQALKAISEANAAAALGAPAGVPAAGAPGGAAAGASRK
jgi:Skp family chaperone for outer membrane proteins